VSWTPLANNENTPPAEVFLQYVYECLLMSCLEKIQTSQVKSLCLSLRWFIVAIMVTKPKREVKRVKNPVICMNNQENIDLIDWACRKADGTGD